MRKINWIESIDFDWFFHRKKSAEIVECNPIDFIVKMNKKNEKEKDEILSL